MNLRMDLLYAVIITILFVMPDVSYCTINPSYKLNSGWQALLFLVPISFGLLYNKFKIVNVIIISALSILQLMQFSRISYFGRLLTQYDFNMIFDEFIDIVIGAIDAFNEHWIIIPIVIIPFIGIWYISTLTKARSKYGTAILIMTIIGTVYVHQTQCTPYPIEGRISISNTIKVVTNYTISLFQGHDIKNYAEYKITNNGIQSNEPITVVYIIGESVNYKHMSLFGYTRETTPLLKKLTEYDNFYYTQGISGAVCTKSSVRFMTNAIYEPDNIKLNDSGETCLFKLAKENGFKTFYIASDEKSTVNSICNQSLKHIDVLITREDNATLQKQLKDDYIIYKLEEQNFEARNFIVLHQRCIHVPYKNNLPKSYKAEVNFNSTNNNTVDEYDTAMLYNDLFISKIFCKFNKQPDGKFYIIFVSDHNELLGENGMFGHSIVEPEVAKVPFLFQSNDEKFMQEIRSLKVIYPYEVAKKIAKILGFEIRNPNEQSDVFYVNGLDYYGRSEYMKGSISGDKLSFEKGRSR